MKKKRVLYIILSILLIALFLNIQIQQYKPKALIADINVIRSISVRYHGEKIYVDKNKLINILSRYYVKKTTYDYFPYQSDYIDTEINFNEGHEPRHILLGKFNILYEAADKGVFNIQNAEKLKEELKSIIK